ncbi:MAG TPA: hypothetical protein VKD69_22975, partial [Vicinamibacterales bacterium]|nr:hypothetical protein [Vicinamibacterales bacterium]
MVIGTAPLASLFSAEQGLTILLLGSAAVGLFAAGVGDQTWGAAGPWFLLAAVLLGWAVRAVDLENAALFIPGGLYGAAKRAFGAPAARAAASVILADSLLFSALSASAAGRAIVAVGTLAQAAAPDSFQRVSLADVTIAIAAGMIGVVWLRLRQGRELPARLVHRTVTAVASGTLVIIAAHAIALLRGGGVPPSAVAFPGLSTGGALVGVLVAIGGCLFVVSSGDAVSHASADFPPPKVRNLRRAMWFVNGYSLIVVAGAGFVFTLIVPASDQLRWHEAPLAALPMFDGLPRWLGALTAMAIAAASVLLLGLAIHRAAIDAHKLLLRLAEDRVLLRAMRELHPRFGTPARLIDLGVVAQMTVVLASGGHLAWIARAYAIAVACGLVVKVAALVRLRTRRPEPRAYRVGLNLRVGGRERPAGLIGVGVLVGVPALLLAATGDLPALGGAALIVVIMTALTISERMARAAAEAAAAVADAELVTMPAIGVDQMHARPGNVLVPVRKPGALAHLATALQNAGDRDVVVLCVRLAGVDASDDVVGSMAPTDQERRVLTDAAMLAERSGRAVRLLIVPAVNVFDSIAATVARLGSSEVYVGESETLTGADQARLLGEAWERIPLPKPLGVRLVVRHGSGRTAEYHLGVHAPALTADDLQVIHDLWLQMVKTVGPHVHHHDVVRA